jgi:hypothetical protein
MDVDEVWRISLFVLAEGESERGRTWGQSEMPIKGLGQRTYTLGFLRPSIKYLLRLYTK